MGEGTITESSTTEQKIHVKLVASGFQSGGVSGNSHWHRYSPRKGRVIGVLPWVLEGGKEGDRIEYMCKRGINKYKFDKERNEDYKLESE